MRPLAFVRVSSVDEGLEFAYGCVQIGHFAKQSMTSPPAWGLNQRDYTTYYQCVNIIKQKPQKGLMLFCGDGRIGVR